MFQGFQRHRGSRPSTRLGFFAVIHASQLTQNHVPPHVARRGEACRRMSALQSKIQVAIRPRPTLARFVCSPKLPRLRCRSRRHERPRCGEGRPAPVCHLTDLLTIIPPPPRCSTLPIPILKCAVAARSWTRATWTRTISTRATILRAKSAMSVSHPNRSIPRYGLR